MTRMRFFTLASCIRGPIHLHTVPYLKTVGNPLRVGLIKDRRTETFASFAALMIDPCIVPFPRVHAYSNGDKLARPSFLMTCHVRTFESSHDVGIVLLGASSVRVLVEKAEVKTILRQIMTNFPMQIWVHGPRFDSCIRFCCWNAFLLLLCLCYLWQLRYLLAFIRHSGDYQGSELSERAWTFPTWKWYSQAEDTMEAEGVLIFIDISILTSNVSCLLVM